MKTIADKKVVVGADFAGCPLKNAVVKHLQIKGWEVLDVGVKNDKDPNPEMFHRVGFKVGSLIAEGEYERGLLFCGTGMGIHVAASKCPHVQSAVCESVPSARRCIAANNCNIMAMGAFYVTNRMGMAMADAYLETKFGDGYEHWDNFYEYHKFAWDEIENFDYDAYKNNGFEFNNVNEYDLGPEPKDLCW